MRTAYLDCIGGISGDMALGALIDAGADGDRLIEGLRSLDLPEWRLEIHRTWKSGIAATQVEVVVRGTAAGDAPLLRLPPTDSPLEGGSGHSHSPESHSHSHSHDSAPPHGHGLAGESTGEVAGTQAHSHAHEHSHQHEHSQQHEHSHQHEPPHAHSHPQAHAHEHLHTHEHSHIGDTAHGTRSFSEVEAVIRKSALPETAKEQAVAVFRRLGAAEAAVHGTTLEQVHFHEVGAVDSIVDVVGAVYALHLLGVEQVVCSPLPNGHGFVKCAHGIMPIPPPATAELLKGCPLRSVDVQGELVTPTGAALASTLSSSFGQLPPMVIRQVGYGAGRKEFPFPNLLRVLVGELTETAPPAEATEVVLVEANIDDQSPQLYDAATAALFSAGALDVWLTPIVMKKGRPATTLSVLCERVQLDRVCDVIFEQTTTLGVRFSDWQRKCLTREWIEVETPYGMVRVKAGYQGGSLRTAMPEYEDCRTCAEERGVPVKLVQAAAAAAAWEALLRKQESG